MFLRTLCLFFLLMIAPASAETVTIQIAIQRIPCDGGQDLAGANQIFYLENYVNGILPDEVSITGAMVWADGGGPIVNSRGNIGFGVDPKSTYINTSGYPARQKTWPETIKTLVMWEIGPGGSRQAQGKFPGAIKYRKGDALIGGPECFPVTGATGDPIDGMFLILFLETNGDWMPLPAANWLLDQPLTEWAIGSPAYSARCLVAAPPVNATKIRVRIYSLDLQENKQDKVSNMSVGIRSGATSNTVSTPVELKFNGQSGYNLSPRQRQWSNWTPINIVAGQELLISMKMFADPNGNAMTYRSSGGLGCWTTPSPDAWNSAVMPGPVTAQPGFMQKIDAVQYQ